MDNQIKYRVKKNHRLYPGAVGEHQTFKMIKPYFEPFLLKFKSGKVEVFFSKDIDLVSDETKVTELHNAIVQSRKAKYITFNCTYCGKEVSIEGTSLKRRLTTLCKSCGASKPIRDKYGNVNRVEDYLKQQGLL